MYNDKYQYSGCRNPSRCKSDLQKLVSEGELGESPSFECLELDLSRIDSVERFAKDVSDAEDKIHVLINNGQFLDSRVSKQTPRY